MKTSHTSTPFFSVVEIETLGQCNRSCHYCPNSIPALARTGRMSEALFSKIIDELAELEFSGRLSFHFYNEPLLDVRLADLVAEAKKKVASARIVIYTNGDLLTAARRAELEANGVDRFIVTNHDSDETATRSSEEQRILMQSSRDLLLTNRGGLLPLLGRPENPLPFACTAPSTMLVITSSGNVVLCYEDAQERTVVGNVQNESICEVWNSAQLRALRAQLAGGDRTVSPACRSCTNTAHLDLEQKDVY